MIACHFGTLAAPTKNIKIKYYFAVLTFTQLASHDTPSNSKYDVISHLLLSRGLTCEGLKLVFSQQETTNN